MSEDLTDWLTQLRVLAAMCEGYADSMVPHDKVLAASMQFVGKRLDQVTEELHAEQAGGDHEWHL